MKYHLAYKELIFFFTWSVVPPEIYSCVKVFIQPINIDCFCQVARASKLNECHYQTGREGTSKIQHSMKVILERAKICLINRPLEIYQKFTVTKVIPILENSWFQVWTVKIWHLVPSSTAVPNSSQKITVHISGIERIRTSMNLIHKESINFLFWTGW